MDQTPTPAFISSDQLDNPQIAHGFFGRSGGVSEGIYAGLNCGLGSQDDPKRVIENRKRLVQALTGEHRPLITPYQIHSPRCLIIEGPWKDTPEQADALATKTPGIVIAVGTADCGPVLFADQVAGIVAAAHAGWKGAVGGVLEETISAMESLGARREHIHAVLGPTISQPSYEVGADFREGFLARDASYERFFQAGKDAKHFQFDLPGFILERLNKAEIASAGWTGQCTYKQESYYFSYRRSTHRDEPDYGRQLAAIGLK